MSVQHLRACHRLSKTLPFGLFNSRELGQLIPTNKLDSARTACTSVGYGVKLPLDSIQNQIVDALRLGERGRASNLLLELSNGSPRLSARHFYKILRHCVEMPDPSFVMETLKILEEKQIGLNNICYRLIMQTLCRGGCLEEAYDFLNFIGESRGIYYSLPLYNCFLGACSKIGDLIHADRCLDMMEHKLLGKNEVTYMQLLKLAVWQKNLRAVHEIWRDYIRHYSPSILPLQKFISSFASLRDLKSANETLQHMVAVASLGDVSVETKAYGSWFSSRLDIPIVLNGEMGLQKLNLRENVQCFPLQTLNHSTSVKHITSEYMESGEGEKVGLTGYMTKPSPTVLRRSFNDVIYACARAQNFNLAEQLMQQMHKLGLLPSSYTYNGFVRAVVSGKGLSEGVDVLKIMQHRNMKLHNMTLLSLSLSCCRMLELDFAEALLDQISSCSSAHPFNFFLAACDKKDQPERAVHMFAKMKQLKIQPDIRTYELLFSLFGNVNAPYEKGNMLSQVDCAKRIRAIEMDMVKNNVQHSHLSMKNLLRALGEEGMTRELMSYLRIAEGLFSRTNSYLGTPIYNTVLHALTEEKESQLAIALFHGMTASGIKPNVATYNIMIDCCSISKDYKSACALVASMLLKGFYPETSTYTVLMKVLLKDEKFDEALCLLDQMHLDGIEVDVTLYNTILSRAFNKGRIDLIELIVEQMHREKIQPDPRTCRYVFKAYVECDFHHTAIEALEVLSMRMISLDEFSLLDRKAEFEDGFIYSEDRGAESRILQFFENSDEYVAVALLNLRWCAILGFRISWSPNQTLWARRLSANYDMKRIQS